MKKISIFTLFALSLILLSSCSKNKGLIIENAQQALDDRPTAEEGYEYLENIGDWLEEEVEYTYYQQENISIFSGNGLGNIYGDNMYFQLQKEETKQDETGYYYTSGKPVYAYINMLTGEKHFLCPDPLCTHGAYSGCQYLDLFGLEEGENGIMYATKLENTNHVIYNIIYEIDTSKGILTPIYTPAIDEEKIASRSISLKYYEAGKLYYHCGTWYEETNEDGEAERYYTQYFVSLDVATKETEVITEKLSDSLGVIGNVWNKMFLYDKIGNKYYLSDMNYENLELIDLEKPVGYSNQNIYFDNNTEELYILMSSDKLYYPEKMDMSDEDIPSYLYKISKDLTVEELTLPNELVMSIQLTEEYIYYTVFDPIYYGSRNGHIITDETGTKIYRVRRDDLTTPELYFDGKGQFISNGTYYIDGGNLYLKHYRAKGGNDNVGFYDTGSIARVNIENNTLAWINLY